MVRIKKCPISDQKIDIEFHSSNSEEFYGIKSIISSIVGSYYFTTTRVWRVPAEDLDDIISKLLVYRTLIIQVDLAIMNIVEQVYKARTELDTLRNRIDGVDCGIKFVDGYELLPFQHVGVEFLCRVKNGILADKVGLGKTMQSFSAALKLIQNNQAKKCIFVVPNKMRLKWQLDIKKFLGIDAQVIHTTGGQSARDLLFKNWAESDSLFCIISYDLVRIDWEVISNYLNFDYGVVFDEIQYLKNMNSKRSKICKELAGIDKCKFKFGLSATYIETGLDNLFNEMLVIDDGVFGKSFSRFAERYLKLDYFGKVIGIRNEEEVKSKMQYVAIRRHKEQVKEQLKSKLPHINENTLWIDMPAEQKKVYNEVLEGVIKAVKDMERAEKISSANILAQMVYLRQVSLSPLLVGSSVKSSGKLEALLEMMPEVVEENKVVVFCHFVKFIDIMEEELKKIGIKSYAIHGQRKEGLDAARIVRKFDDNNDVKVLLASDMIKEGQDIPSASYVMNMDILWNPASMTQRVGRIDRLNQKSENIYIVNFWNAQGIDQDMYKVVYEREGMANTIMDDGYQEKRVKKLSFGDLKKMLRRA